MNSNLDELDKDLQELYNLYMIDEKLKNEESLYNYVSKLLDVNEKYDLKNDLIKYKNLKYVDFLKKELKNIRIEKAIDICNTTCVYKNNILMIKI